MFDSKERLAKCPDCGRDILVKGGLFVPHSPRRNVAKEACTASNMPCLEPRLSKKQGK